MTVSSSSGGLGLPTGDLVVIKVCGTIGVVADRNSSGRSWEDGDGDESVTMMSGT